MAERLASMTDVDKERLWSKTKSLYFHAMWLVPLALAISWAFSWFLMRTIWFGLIASILMLFPVIVIVIRFLKVKNDIADGRKRIVTGVVNDHKITFVQHEARFEFDDISKTLLIEATYNSSNNRPHEVRQNLPYIWPKELQEDPSLCYTLLIDDKSYQVPRDVFIAHRLGMEFEGCFTLTGEYIR